MSVAVVRSARLSAVRHGFLGREGGVSRGLVSGLNVGLSAGDHPDDVAENRRRAVAAVAPGARLVTVHQVHSPLCVVAGEWRDAARPHADALVTDRPDVVLGIVTADCAPILLADSAAGVVGAAHAGWKGALGGVIEATVAAMAALGARPHRIAAAVGPCIAQASYEVDRAFRDRFLAADPTTARFFAEGRTEHAQFDLEGYCGHRLARAGVAQVDLLGEDTRSQPTRFFSFRRATLAGEPTYGRQFSLIARPDEAP